MLAQDIKQSTEHIRKVASRASLDPSLQSDTARFDQIEETREADEEEMDPQLLNFLASLLSDEMHSDGEIHTEKDLTQRHLVSMLARAHRILTEKDEQILKSASVGQMLLDSNARMADSIEQLKLQVEDLESRLSCVFFSL